MKTIVITESQYNGLLKEDEVDGRLVVYMMCGIPGSGKSTWCGQNHPDLPVVSRDIIRAEMGFTKSADEKAVLTREQEQAVTEEEYKKMEKLIAKGQSFIIDDTNSNPRFRKEMIDFLKSHDVKIVGVNVNTDLDLCIQRRAGQIPPEAIMRMHGNRVPLTKDDVDDIIDV